MAAVTLWSRSRTRGWHAMSSSLVPLKTRRVEETAAREICRGSNVHPLVWFHGDKSGLHDGCSNIFQRNFVRSSGFQDRRFDRYWHEDLISFITPSSQKLLHQLFELSSTRHRVPPIADRGPHPARLPQSETTLPRIVQI
ncbi:hypothetical protein TNCV_4246751 [Trichonephila clavipes]|nr:hypothetical protein TNCV_4246751 [Trichonephila clavipes]